MTAPRYTIYLQRAVTKIIGGGTPASTWSILVSLRAAIVAESATEKVTERGAASATEITFRVRAYPGISLGDRIAFRGRAFNVTGVTPVEGNRYLDLAATSVEP